MTSAGVLGKRKRKAIAKVKPEPEPESMPDAAAMEDAQAIFRRHFEAQFAPIQTNKGTSKHNGMSKKKKAGGVGGNDDDDDDDDDADGVEDMRSDSESDENAWDGISGEEDSEGDDSDGEDEEGSKDDLDETVTNTVQVVDYSKPLPSSTVTPQLATMTKREMRAYLSSRPPDATFDTLTSNSKPKLRSAENDDLQNEDSKSLLANDLELQRLINESHILSASNPFNSIGSRSSTANGGSGGKTFVEGRTRTLTTDLRLQQLGSKESILKQRRMPMGMRKGINAAKGAKEEKRRREARENGIILEKEDKGKGGGKRSKTRRGDMPVDMPGMGIFKGGELKLSKREVRAVEMEGMRMDYGGKRRRRRR